MDYTKTYDTIINYLVDKNIKGNENDTTLSKIEKFLLKYKRIIAIVLLILLLYIGNQCNLGFITELSLTNFGNFIDFFFCSAQ